MNQDQIESPSTQRLAQASRPIRSKLKDGVLLSALGLVVAGGGALGYVLGHQHGLQVLGTLGDVGRVQKKLEEQEKQVSILSQKLTSTTQERDLAMANNKGTIDTVVQQNQDQSLAEGRVEAYRRALLARGGVPLTLQKIEIVPVTPNTYEYRVDLMQVRSNKSTASGTLALRLVDGQKYIDVPIIDNKVAVSEFQRMLGQWVMPEGFSPKFVEVYVVAGGQKLDYRFAWEHGQPFKYMPVVSVRNAPEVQVNTIPQPQSAKPVAAPAPASTPRKPKPKPQVDTAGDGVAQIIAQKSKEDVPAATNEPPVEKPKTDPVPPTEGEGSGSAP